MWETDSEQVLWRKDEKNFEKRDNRFESVDKEAVEELLFAGGICSVQSAVLPQAPKKA